MIILDSNVLLYSVHLDFVQHQSAKAFLASQLKDDEKVEIKMSGHSAK